MNSVNAFQNSVVHGLSFTDEYFNIPKSYVLAVVTIVGTVWLIIAIIRRKLQTVVAIPVIYIVLVFAGQLGSVAVQNFIVSPSEFTRRSEERRVGKAGRSGRAEGA